MRVQSQYITNRRMVKGEAFINQYQKAKAGKDLGIVDPSIHSRIAERSKGIAIVKVPTKRYP